MKEGPKRQPQEAGQNQLFVAALGVFRSAFAVWLTIPVILWATGEMLRIVSNGSPRGSSRAGGARVVIPTGLAGIITTTIPALARAPGETAPPLVLVGYLQFVNFDIFGGFTGSPPGMMYDQRSAGAGSDPVPTDRLWALC